MHRCRVGYQTFLQSVLQTIAKDICCFVIASPHTSERSRQSRRENRTEE